MSPTVPSSSLNLGEWVQKNIVSWQENKMWFRIPTISSNFHTYWPFWTDWHRDLKRSSCAPRIDSLSSAPFPVWLMVILDAGVILFTQVYKGHISILNYIIYIYIYIYICRYTPSCLLGVVGFIMFYFNIPVRTIGSILFFLPVWVKREPWSPMGRTWWSLRILRLVKPSIIHRGLTLTCLQEKGG